MRGFAGPILAVLALCSSRAYAQTEADLQTGMTPFSAYHGGDVDNVSLSNGNLVVKIPLVSYPERGGKLTQDYELVYNGKPWSESQFCVTLPQPPYTKTCFWGWSSRQNNPSQPGQAMGAGWIFGDNQSLGLSQNEYSTTNQGNTYDYFFGNVLTMDGASHPLVPVDDTHQRAVDGSGFVTGMTFLDGNGQMTPCSANCALLDGKGTAYNLGGGIVREDTNGNQLTDVDTMGRQIPAATSTSNYTGCTGTLATTSAMVWQAPGYNGGTLTYKFCMASVAVSIPAGTRISTAKGVSGYQTVLQSIALPNGQAWTFQYSSRNAGDPQSVNYGDLTQITFPTGATVSYTYGVNWSNQAPPYMGSSASSMWVASRTENANDGNTLPPSVYTWAPMSATGAVTNTVTDPAGNDTAHTFSGFYSPFETSVVSYQGSAAKNQVLKQVQTAYQCWPGQPYNGGNESGCFPVTVTTTLGSQVSQKTLTYGNTFVQYQPSVNANYGQVTQSSIYDYGSGSPGALLRQELTSYQFETYPQYLTDNLLGLIGFHTVYDANTNRVAEQIYTYDETNYFTPSSITTQHGTPISAVRGNLSTSTAWLSGGTNPASHTNWYDTGEPYQQIDPRGNATTMLYSATYAGALPTTVTNAKQQSTTLTYDFNLGVKTSVVDPNNQTTTWGYDTLGRTVSIVRPEVFPGSATHSHATICYDDVAAQCTSSSPVNAVVVTEAVNPSTNLQEEEQVDGFGRKTLTRLLSDPDGITYTRTAYDSLGHAYESWNSTRCNPMTQTSCTGETTWGITTHLYDGISREITTIPPDGNATANNVTIAYTGNQTTATDQAGISHQSTTDALGRLTQVSEVNMGWTTLYSYDALGNLLCVEQHGSATGTGCSSNPSNDATSPWRVRRFTYDTLSRLLTAKNPETGTITYQYDANGNVVSKTDARGITVNYSPTGSPIDVLNRVTQKTYSDSEPSVTYTYDSTSVTNGIGRRTGMSDLSGSTTWNYDPAGKVTTESRTINGISKTLTTTYDLLDNPYEITYPSGSVVQYTPSGAGRILSAVDITHGINYVTATTYAPTGALKTSTYGAVAGGFAGISLSDSYNSRLQPILLSATAPTATLLSLNYTFGLGTNDNGNVQGIVNNKNSARNQAFGYDGVNRLTSAKSGTWGVQFTYDAWGNMTQTAGIPGTGLTNPMPEPVDRSATVQNQLASSLVTYGYSVNGNMTADGSGQTYTLDGENRILATGGTTYSYDGDGERVAKSSGTGTLYWGDLSESDGLGNLTSEYVFVGGERVARRDVSSGSVYYYLQDHLGSSSVVTNALGVIQNESDFYPFGGENQISDNLANQKYKFTDKERDTETGNDYFGARYYSSTLGRFLSPDWAAKAEPIPYAKLDNPQSLNLYAYVQGNTETLSDHDGHIIFMSQLYDYTAAAAVCASQSNSGFADADMENMAADLAAQQAAQASTTTTNPTATQTAQQPAAQQNGGQQAQQNQVIFIGTKKETKALEKAWKQLMKSQHARDLETSVLQQGNLAVESSNSPPHYDPTDRSIDVNPHDHPVVPTTAGPQAASTAIILGHELGHANGPRDDGPGNMNNVRQNENPIRRDLGLPERTEY